MPTVKEVERALRQAGEPLATSAGGGFYARTLGRGNVIVRWHVSHHHDVSGVDLAFVEGYASILRDAGFNATAMADMLGVRVVCSPTPALHWSAARRRQPLCEVG